MQVTQSNDSNFFTDIRDTKGQRILGQKYALIKRVNKQEANEIEKVFGIHIPFKPGETEVKPVVGEGNFGKVSIAERLVDHTYVVVKKIKDAWAILESKCEAEIQKKLLNKPHIMPLYDFIEAESKKTKKPAFYQFMPLAGLGNVDKLRQQLIKLNDIQLKELIIIHISRCLLLALWHMHQSGIYHLDIKPNNLVVDVQGEVYLIDFGCAVELDAIPPLLTPGKNSEGVFQGKGDQEYASKIRCQAIQNQTPFDCAKADLYAAGLSILELLSGKRFSQISSDEQTKLSQNELGCLAISLLDETNPDYPTLEKALNFPVFQKAESHDSSLKDTAITYLKNFVRKTHFQLRESQSNRPTQLNYGISVKQFDEKNNTVMTATSSIEEAKPVPDVQEEVLPDSFKFPILQESMKNLDMYVPLRCSKDHFSKEGFELEETVDHWLNGPANTLLLLADGGSGKTTFCLSYALGLNAKKNENSNSNTSQNWLPLYIPLGSVNDPKNLLEEVLKNQYHFNNKLITYLKTHRQLLLILDGYDEMKTPINLFVENNWQDWKIKVLITCRMSVLQSGYQIHFLPYQKDVAAATSNFEELYILPSSLELINQYLATYIQVQQPRLLEAVQKRELDQKWLSESSYQEAFKSIKGLSELIKNPFLLRLIVDVLPRLEHVHLNKKEVTVGDIYEAFITQWIERQSKKGTAKTSQDAVWEYGQRLAEAMHEQDVVQVRFSPRWIFNRQEGLFIEEQNSWSRFFSNQSVEAKVLREHLPLQQEKEQTYSFIHLSLLEYFVARKWVNELKDLGLPIGRELPTWKEKASKIGLLRYPLTQSNKNATKLHFLSDWANSDEILQAILFHLITTSKNEPQFAIGAANAISILNRAGISFSGLDLSNVKIPYADLSTAILDHTNLSRADLTGVKLQNACLRNTQLVEACLQDVYFGEKPYLQIKISDYKFFKSKVRHLAFTPDGSTLAVSATGTKIWNLREDEGQFHVPGAVAAKAVVFSSDSKIIATSGKECRLKIWQITKSRVVEYFNAQVVATQNNLIPSAIGTSSAINQSINRFAWAAKDFSVKVFSTGPHPAVDTRFTYEAKLRELYHLKGHTALVSSLAFSQDDKLLVSGSHDRNVVLWSLENGQEKQRISFNVPIRKVVFSPDSSIVAIGSNGILLWTLDNKQCKNLTVNPELVRALAFNSNGTILASGSNDATIRLLSVSSGETLHVLSGHSDKVRCLAFSPDNKLLASGSNDQTVRFWEIEGRQDTESTNRHFDKVTAVILDSKEDAVFSASKDGTICKWSLSTRKLLEKTLIKESSPLLLSAWSNRDRLQWFANKEKVDDISNIQGAFSPNNKFAAVAGIEENNIHLSSLVDGQELYRLEGHKKNITCLVFNPDNATLASGSRDETIRIWKVESGQVQHILKGHDKRITALAYSLDGLTLASGSRDKSIRLWSTINGNVQQVLKGHKEEVSSIVFSPDGKTLATGSKDRTVRLWDLATGSCLTVLDDYFGGISSIAWHPKGFLITGCDDHSVKCWQIVKKDHQTINCQLAWSTHVSLYAKNCQLDRSNGLSPIHAKLLQQFGATGGPISADKQTSTQEDSENNNSNSVKPSSKKSSKKKLFEKKTRSIPLPSVVAAQNKNT